MANNASYTTIIFSEIKRLKLAFSYSAQGLKSAYTEPAFRIEVIAAAIAIPLALLASHSASERGLLIGSIFLVLIVELLNTAVETAINRISLETHPLSKKAKDIASAAVLLSIINAVFIWLVVLWN